MPRRPRPVVDQALFHVAARGNAPGAILGAPSDRIDFLTRLDLATVRFDRTCGAYCLMHTHYHLLLKASTENLVKGIHWLHSGYARSFNAQHGCAGGVLCDRYRMIVVESERHGLELCRYIALNPVRAGLVDHPADWRWGSYAATIGEVPAPPFLTTALVLELFAGHGGLASGRSRLRAFVDDALAAETIP